MELQIQVASPQQMWDNFVKRLSEVEPLEKPVKDKKGNTPTPRLHTNFIGSIESYRKIFMEANKS